MTEYEAQVIFHAWHKEQCQWHLMAGLSRKYKWHREQAKWHNARLNTLPLSFFVAYAFKKNAHLITANVTKNNSLFNRLKAK